MVFGLVATAFLLTTGDNPLDAALTRTEAPVSLRAAFTVEMTDGEAYRRLSFDPREDSTWHNVEAEGVSFELDQAVEDWGEFTSPDGWLFADDLRASMGDIVETEDLGAAWKVHFQHHLSDNDGPIDRWAAKHLAGSAWLEPIGQYFFRVDYESYEPFRMPNGGLIDYYEHNYLFRQDSEYDISYIWAFKVDIKGSYRNERIDRSYRVQVTEIEFFYASTSERENHRADMKARAQDRAVLASVIQ